MPQDKIAVLCAYNPQNSGMYSVDLAARQFFSKLGRPYDLCITQLRSRSRELPYKRIYDASDLREYGSIVYWGDFQNNPMYGVKDYAPRSVKYDGVPNLEAGYRLWEKLYLNLAEEVGTDVSIVSVGGCFIGMESYLEETRWFDSFKSFTRSARQIIPRDTVSISVLSGIPGADAHKLALGFDCAALLQLEPRPSSRKNYFVYSFGRSIEPAKGKSIVRWIEDKFNIRAIPVTWLSPKWPKLFAHREFMRNIAMIRGAKFVITDTYHLVINSVRENTPIFCLSRPESREGGTLNELKKHTLMEMLDAKAFQVTIESTNSEVSIRERIAESISSCRPEDMLQVNQRFSSRRNALEQKLLSLFS